jgi:FAD/FMN-containing dehydrogenase
VKRKPSVWRRRLGSTTDTGIAGLTLGGGYGWLGGKFGLACDNLLSVDVVTVDGRLVVASAAENEDLFWGVRGAGANLGIVTSFEYRLHPVGPALGGIMVYPLARGRELLQLFDEFSHSCPDEVSTAALLFTTPTGDPAVAIAVCYSGTLDRARKFCSGRQGLRSRWRMTSRSSLMCSCKPCSMPHGQPDASTTSN